MKWTRDAPKLAGNGSPREARPLIHYYICEVYCMYSMYITRRLTIPYHSIRKFVKYENGGGGWVSCNTVLAECSAEKLFLVPGVAQIVLRIFTFFNSVLFQKSPRPTPHFTKTKQTTD